VRWSQDARGEDVYEESKDLVYFPRLMSIEPKQKRVVRVGTQAAPGEGEGTYRLIIEEMMPPAPGGPGTNIAVRMRFAIPIFVAPAQPERKPVVEQLALARGEVRFRLRNAGNQHVKLETLSLRRGDKVLQEAAGWYVLPGAQREFAIALPAAECKAGKVQLVLKGEGVELKHELDVDAARCRP
jgi:fimbrial chaperone protein